MICQCRYKQVLLLGEKVVQRRHIFLLLQQVRGESRIRTTGRLTQTIRVMSESRNCPEQRPPVSHEDRIGSLLQNRNVEHCHTRAGSILNFFLLLVYIHETEDNRQT
ncbi:hypothetical protein X975_01941, partial [Stegodyphus mimosarum]